MSKHKLAHFFIPHKKNNYRAHFLKPIALHTAILFILGLQFAFFFIGHSSPSVLGVSYSISTDDVIAQTNDQRGKNGLSTLTRNGQLTRAAELKGQDMLAKGYWAHTSPDGKEPWYFILQAGYNYNRAGENLARDFRDTTSVVNAWMNSPGHRANILNSHYQEIGVAVVSGPFNGYDAVIVVQMFGEPLNGKSTANSLSQPQTAGAQVLQTPKPAVGKQVALKLENNSSTTSTDLVSATGAASLTKPDDIQTVVNQESAPAIDPIKTTRTVIFAVGIFFISLLLIDAVIVAKQRIKREKHGHSLLHALFLIIIMLSLIAVQTGLIL
jgi:hypothetical protein